MHIIFLMLQQSMTPEITKYIYWYGESP